MNEANEMLFEAAEKETTKRVLQALELGADVNAVEQGYSMTALMLAAITACRDSSPPSAAWCECRSSE